MIYLVNPENLVNPVQQPLSLRELGGSSRQAEQDFQDGQDFRKEPAFNRFLKCVEKRCP